MILGNVRILTMTELSDAYEAVYTLLEHTYEYDGKQHSTSDITFYNGSFAYDLFENEIKAKAKEMNTNDYHLVAETIYREFCEKNNIMFLSYNDMEELERIIRENTK